MKFSLISILILVSIALPVSARLGETQQECEKRYGKPIATRQLKRRDGYENLYKRGNYEVRVKFVRSTRTAFQRYEAGYLSFRKIDESEFDDKTIKKLLKKNCRDQVLYAKLSRNIYWEEVKKPGQKNIDREWRRVYKYYDHEFGKNEEKTGFAKARANLSDDNVLVITSHFPLPRGYKNREERAKNEDAARQEQNNIRRF